MSSSSNFPNCCKSPEGCGPLPAQSLKNNARSFVCSEYQAFEFEWKNTGLKSNLQACAALCKENQHVHTLIPFLKHYTTTSSAYFKHYSMSFARLLVIFHTCVGMSLRMCLGFHEHRMCECVDSTHLCMSSEPESVETL